MNDSVKTNRTGKAVKATPMPNLSERFSPSQLAEAITAKRTGMKLSQVNVSEAVSISKPTLVKIEKGDTNVKLASLLNVMEYLGLSFSLLSDDGMTCKAKGLSDDWY
ncbi:helix-turn-helix domain-containing protein [Paraglaciecola sp. L3A3]|uniref:helix-turn-helix domain-containing protein n=1 Tax=Paraglaciecola sp. L3A3 TaxID=2686358 RepID=UPI001E5AF90D|nr:helix-turn-helix domain-containing protein [Paraglaciecola sp. L3A3]